MKTVDKTQLKANLLELLKIVELQGEEILVTEGTKPVARISPYQKSYSTMDGSIKIVLDTCALR